jgi:hypothetical protein
LKYDAGQAIYPPRTGERRSSLRAECNDDASISEHAREEKRLRTNLPPSSSTNRVNKAIHVLKDKVEGGRFTERPHRFAS